MNNRICQIVLAELLCVGINEKIIKDKYLENINESFLKLFKDNIQLIQNEKTIEHAIKKIKEIKNNKCNNKEFSNQTEEFIKSLEDLANAKSLPKRKNSFYEDYEILT